MNEDERARKFVERHFPEVAAFLAAERGEGPAPVRGERTVTVQTVDHGAVTTPEPFWCVGRHAAGEFRADLAHEGEAQLLFVDTPHGPAKVATASLYQRPFAEQSTRAVTVSVDFDASHEFDSASLAGLADSLVSWSVGPLHALIERLQLLEGGAS